MPTNEVLHLALNSVLRVAGEVTEGEVHADFNELQRVPVEEVYVKLRGTIFTYVVCIACSCALMLDITL